MPISKQPLGEQMTLQSVENAIGIYVKWLKAHEKLAFLVLGGFLLFHFGEKGLTAWENHDKRQATATQQQLDVSLQQNKDIQVQLAALKVQVDQSAKQLDFKIAQSKQNLQTQQQADLKLPLPLLADRWNQLLVLPPGSIQSQASGAVKVTPDGAYKTVTQLEQIPALTEQLNDTQQKLDGCQQVRDKQDQQIQGLNTSLILEQKGRAEDAKVAKDNEHKAWRRGFKWGYIAGIGTAIWAKIAGL